jgi:hypothetical protein
MGILISPGSASTGWSKISKKIRGIRLDHILRNLHQIKSRVATGFTVNTVNHREIGAFLRRMSLKFPDIPVRFFFHTHYYEKDALYLTPAQRKQAVDALLRAKRARLPVLNSAAARNSYLAGNPHLPNDFFRIVDRNGEYRCCRAKVIPRSAGIADIRSPRRSHRPTAGT